MSVGALCLVVVVHEFGHFIVAKKSGMAVEVFSVGFGKPLWSVVWGGTRYQIAPILLGGYVKPKGEFEEKEGEEGKPRDDDEFLAKPWYTRAAVLVAGPIMNFIFPLIAMFLLFFLVGIQEGPPTIERVMDGRPAASAGLMEGDTLLEIDGIQVPSYTMIADLVDRQARSHPDKPLNLKLLRGGEVIEKKVEAELNKDYQKYLMGITVKPGSVALTTKVLYPQVGTPAERAGIQAGDRIMRVDGKTVRDGNSFSRLFSGWVSDPVPIEIERGGENLVIEAPKEQLSGDHGLDLSHLGLIGVTFELDKSTLGDGGSAYKPLSLVDSARLSFGYVATMSVNMVGGIWHMISGKISATENLGGPITIMRMAHQRSKTSLYDLMEFMCMISLILGIMNLLPVPLLDGGTFTFCLLEGLRGKPLSYKTQTVLQNVGLLMLGSLMLFATYNDIVRWITSP
jgi:regulator of sigma E protease